MPRPVGAVGNGEGPARVIGTPVGLAADIAFRYLRSKKRQTISVITVIAVTGVALGVAALLAVLAITTGFQEEFRNKVLGVNAHVLVMKYGVDFDEYRDVMALADGTPGVAASAPFLLQDMMLAKGDRLANVLVKGIDPERMGDVLDLPGQIIEGGLEGLRRPGTAPPEDPDEDDEVDDGYGFLDALEGDGEAAEEGGAVDAGDEVAPPSGTEVASPSEANDWLAMLAGDADEGGRQEELPTPEVASPSEVEELLGALEDPGEGAAGEGLEAWERRLVDEQLAERPDAGESTEGLPGLVVGATLARQVGLGVGDRIRLVSPLSGVDLGSFGEGRVPRSRDFRVIGVFQAGFQEYDSRLVYADLHEAQHFYGQGDAVTGVEMRVDDLDASAAIAWELERELGGPFHTIDWAELNVNLFTALRLQKLVLSLVIATLIFVAAFTVVATLIMIVLEKKREIAILKAMGATSWTVLRVFVVQGTVIGLAGTLLGLLVGGGLVAYLATLEFPLDPKVYLIDHLPVVVDGSEFVVTAIVSLLICSLSTVAPSAWAANMLPVDGLRYE